MNRAQSRTAMLIGSLLITGISCKKKSNNPIDNLPPLTTIVANAFECIFNGQVFLPKLQASVVREPLNFSYGMVNNKKSLTFSVEKKWIKGFCLYSFVH
ncbi:hypothetical protein ASE74_20705 [Pedobacter sp. Leaf216]|nr:hypothetical protein ASE74_20705 [Pedobacter sp. Leaf216]